MTRISKGTKVHVAIGGRSVPGVVISHSFASNGMYDLYMVRIAEYGEARGRYIISEYGPVQSERLTQREMVLPELDRENERVRYRRKGPEWVQRLQD
jgi:hypothetical protein